jgi:hypothetical protein
LNPTAVLDDPSRDTLDGGNNRDWVIDFALTDLLKSFSAIDDRLN